MSPPPEIAATAASPACVLSAPGTPANVNLDTSKVRTDQAGAVQSAVAAIFNTAAYLQFVSETQTPDERKAAWEGGPWGQNNLSLQAYFGNDNDTSLAALQNAMATLVETMTARKLVIVSSPAPGYHPRENTLTLGVAPPATTAKLMVGMMVVKLVSEPLQRAAGGKPSPQIKQLSNRLTDYIHNRQSASGDCLVTSAQVPAPEPEA